MNSTFKVCLIGGAGTGKTTFLTRHSTGEFCREYNPTKGVNVSELSFATNEGQYTLKVWDTAGCADLEGLGDAYYIQADAAIAFYDQKNIERTNQLVTNFVRVCPEAPIINVWSKSDRIQESQFVKATAKEHRSRIVQGNRTTYQVSSFNNYNYEKPFLEILRVLSKKPNLCFAAPKPLDSSTQ
jgi:GTP-binding nuclear protein Ran